MKNGQSQRPKRAGKAWVSVSEILDALYGRVEHNPAAAHRGEEIHEQIHKREVERELRRRR